MHTPLCDLLGCRHPLMLAGMGGISRSDLVVAVSEAGGFGFLGMARESPALIRAELELVRSRTRALFGVSLVPAATPARLLREQLALCVELAVPVVGLFWDVDQEVVARLRAAGIVVVHQVGSAVEALLAQEAGAQLLIAQGVEAGGHVRGQKPLRQLLPEVLAVAHVPVAAAGGLVDGRDVARVLDQGAQAAVLGTVFVATQESYAHDYYKQRLVQARAEDAVLSEDFHLNWPSHARVRVLASSVTRGERGDSRASRLQVIGEESGRPVYLFGTDSPLRSTTGDFEAMALYAGQGVGRINQLEPAGRCLQRILGEAVAHWRLIHEDEMELSSPVCYAADVERDRNASLIVRLDELLAAERAGARVALRSLAESSDPVLRKVLDAMHRDAVRWCAMLMQAIRRLKGQPGMRTGAFYEQAMAVPDLHKRLALLNHGQNWVIRKLCELLVMVEDPGLRQELGDMQQAHENNQLRVASLLESQGRGPDMGLS
nr:nitronate monooxygenase [Comamonas composti]